MNLRATLCVLALTLLAPLSEGSADEFTLTVLLVNMTPDPVSEESRACSAMLRRLVRNDRDSLRDHILRGMGETAFREALGNPEGDFMTWDPELLDRVQEDEAFETAVLYDCRPNARTLRVMIVSTQIGTLNVVLEDVEISNELITEVGSQIFYASD